MSILLLNIYDGTRQLFAAPGNFLVTIYDGNQKQQHAAFHKENHIAFDLPFYDGAFGDNYRVIVSMDGYRQAGYAPVRLSDKYAITLDIMLVANDPGFSFVNARYLQASAAYPFLANGVTNTVGEARYDALLDQQERSLACLLNLGEAMSQINLAQGTPLDYIKQLRWDAPFAPAPDRFFAWADIRLIDQVRRAAAEGKFAEEKNPGVFHPGATSSWKQIQFGEANVQLTFHEGDKTTIDGTSCVLVEPDIDYFSNIAAHTILEVIPNKLTHTLTNPVDVYVLRWIAGQTAGIPEFAPLYTIT